MPTFGSPFSGLAKDKKLTDAENFYAEGAKEVETEIRKMKQRMPKKTTDKK